MTVQSSKYTPYVFLSILLVRIIPLIGLYLFRGDAVFNTAETDPLLYLGGAQSILSSGINIFPFFPPLNFLFIAGFLYLGGGNAFVPVLATACIGWISVVVLYCLARELFDERAALIAAVLAGLYPNFIFFGVNLYPETLAIFFILCSFFLLVKYFKTSHLIYVVCAGIMWGLASQTRGGLHFFSCGIVAAIVLHGRSKGWIHCFKPVCAVLVSIYCVMFAISFFAKPFYGEMSLNSQSGVGSALHGANRLINCNPDYGQVRGSLFYRINEVGESWPDRTQLYSDELMRQDSYSIIKEFVLFAMEEPAAYLKSGFERMSFLWSPNQLIIKFIQLNFHYRAPFFAVAACLAISMFFVLILCGGVLGLWCARDTFRTVFLLFIVFYCFLIFFTVGNAKLRLPLMPFMMLYAGYVFSLLSRGTLTFAKSSAACICLVCGLIILNSVYRYNEIALSPGECNVRQVETSLKLGFPETASFLLEKNMVFQHYTEQQRMRLNTLRQKLQAREQQ